MAQMNQETNGQQITIYTDGSGARPDGKGSCFAWLRTDTGQKKITPKDGLTNNQAEYHAILSAVESLTEGAHATILSDSENICCQLNGQHRILDPTLAGLYDEIYDLIEKNRLIVNFVWIPRRQNLAGKLI
jgi:ribonuclease HI